MPTIFVDNKPYEVREGQHLLEACLSLGFDLPYFCWHPALNSVGACRQCAVKQFKDQEDQQGKIVMACLTPAADGTRISIKDTEAEEFRAGVIEWLMVNHPHDCPVCDEGGECHLQDMTVMTGHTYRECRFPKRTHHNQYLGPFINHEMNRCIECYRCVRFYRDYAGGRDFDVFGAHDHVYFGRQQDGVLENDFSGNLVEVCPTGVFTDKTLKEHYTRKWDLQTAPSICTHCSLGCNTIPGERYGLLRRIRNRYNGEVNGYFLCDRGRYGYEFVNSDKRIRQPIFRDESDDVPKPDAIQRLARLAKSSGKVIGIGSPRASLEDNFALRTFVGPERFCNGLSPEDSRLLETALNILRQGPARTPSLREIEQCDAVLVLGEDVSNTAPMMALALRQSIRRQPLKHAAQLKIPLWNDAGVRDAVQDRKGPLFVATPYVTKLDDAATQTFNAAPDDIARLGFAVAHALDAKAPAPTDLSEGIRQLAQVISKALKEAKRPLVISGTGCASEAVMQAAANVASALCREAQSGEIALALPESNSAGLGLLGGINLASAIRAVKNGEAQSLLILENDLFRHADIASVSELMDAAQEVVVLDHLETATTAKADGVLPSATFAEGSGTLVNNEGRAQRFYQVFPPSEPIQESWRWLRDGMIAAGRNEVQSWQNLDAIDAALTQEFPVFHAITDIAPTANYRVAGLRIPRQSHRYSGRTSMHANINVNEPKPPEDPDSPLAFSMEGFERQPPASLVNRFWAPGWNSVQAVNKFQAEIAGPLVGGDPGRRLIEVSSDESIEYFIELPTAFDRRNSEWLAVPMHHVFGSEELSVLSRGINERSPGPYLGLNAADAQEIGVKSGESIEFTLCGQTRLLPVQIVTGLPAGVAGVPVGLQGLKSVTLPTWIELGGGQ